MAQARDRTSAAARLAAILAVAGLLLGGCGGGSKQLSKSQYVSRIKGIGQELGDSINATTSATTPKEAATALASVQSALHHAVSQLDAITPPNGAKAGQAALTKAAGELADELGPVITKLRKGNLAALAEVTSLKGFTDLQNAADTLTKAGYDIEA